MFPFSSDGKVTSHVQGEEDASLEGYFGAWLSAAINPVAGSASEHSSSLSLLRGELPWEPKPAGAGLTNVLDRNGIGRNHRIDRQDALSAKDLTPARRSSEPGTRSPMKSSLGSLPDVGPRPVLLQRSADRFAEQTEVRNPDRREGPSVRTDRLSDAQNDADRSFTQAETRHRDRESDKAPDPKAGRTSSGADEAEVSGEGRRSATSPDRAGMTANSSQNNRGGSETENGNALLSSPPPQNEDPGSNAGRVSPLALLSPKSGMPSAGASGGEDGGIGADPSSPSGGMLLAHGPQREEGTEEILPAKDASMKSQMHAPETSVVEASRPDIGLSQESRGRPGPHGILEAAIRQTSNAAARLAIEANSKATMGQQDQPGSLRYYVEVTSDAAAANGTIGPVDLAPSSPRHSTDSCPLAAFGSLGEAPDSGSEVANRSGTTGGTGIRETKETHTRLDLSHSADRTEPGQPGTSSAAGTKASGGPYPGTPTLTPRIQEAERPPNSLGRRTSGGAGSDGGPTSGGSSARFASESPSEGSGAATTHFAAGEAGAGTLPRVMEAALNSQTQIGILGESADPASSPDAGVLRSVELVSPRQGSSGILKAAEKVQDAAPAADPRIAKERAETLELSRARLAPRVARSLLVELPSERKGEELRLRFVQRPESVDVRMQAGSERLAQDLRSALPILMERLEPGGMSIRQERNPSSAESESGNARHSGDSAFGDSADGQGTFGRNSSRDGARSFSSSRFSRMAKGGDSPSSPDSGILVPPTP